MDFAPLRTQPVPIALALPSLVAMGGDEMAALRQPGDGEAIALEARGTAMTLDFRTYRRHMISVRVGRFLLFIVSGTCGLFPVRRPFCSAPK